MYSVGLGAYGALPFDAKQSAEIWITAAQSFFALAILVNFEISVREAVGLFVLFLSQVVIEFAILRLVDASTVLPVLGETGPELLSRQVLIAYAVVYVVLGTVLFVRRRRALRDLFGRTRDTIRVAAGKEPREQWAD